MARKVWLYGFICVTLVLLLGTFGYKRVMVKKCTDEEKESQIKERLISDAKKGK